MNSDLKTKAIELRKAGKTYIEICSELKVAKSTLSIWLRSVGLSTQQKQRITKKKILGARRGALRRRANRLGEIERYSVEGIGAIGVLSVRDLWLIGIALYWAEGSKQNDRSPSAGLRFSNMDPRMIAIFLQWLRLWDILDESITFELYVHESRSAESKVFCGWWERTLHLARGTITYVYLKRGNLATRRKNIGDLYHGLLRIKVKKSTTMNRAINGLIHGIVTQLGSGVTGNTSAFEAEDSRIVP